MLVEVAVYNVFIYLDLVNFLPDQSYIRYLSYLIPPILFQMVVNVFTPDEGTETRPYFEKNMRLIFTLMAFFVASHFIYSFNEIYVSHYIRILFIFLLLAIAYFRKEWLIYLGIVLWLTGLYLRAFTMVA